jgi:hypothetical protein
VEVTASSVKYMEVTAAVLNADYRLAAKYHECKTFMVSEARVI